MANSQVPWGLEALNGAVTEPAWKKKPVVVAGVIKEVANAKMPALLA